jgi:hypothetical protein
MLSQEYTPQRIFTIRQRQGDGKFVSRTDRPHDDPLAIDADLEAAATHARHAADHAASTEGCRVLVMAENAHGFMERVAAVEPRTGPARDGSFVVLL